MGHQCVYVDRVEIEEDYETESRYLVRIVEASWKDKYMDVYKAYESGGYYCDDRYYARNLYYCSMGGYLVTFPGEEHMNYYYYGYYAEKGGKQSLEDWGNTAKCNLRCVNIIDVQSEANIIELYPGFKYVLKKMNDCDKYVERVMDLLEMWKKHPEIEGLCQLGFYDIALNNNLYKLTMPKRKQIIKWIMENAKLIEYPQYMKLVHIQKMIKYHVTVDEYIDYDMHRPSISKWNRNKRERWVCDIPTFMYLKKKGYVDARQKDIAELYHDYYKMAKRVGHDMEDNYWRFPSDIGKAHAKVMDEFENCKSTASALQGEYLKAVMQPLAEKFNATVDGYDIFLPTDINDIKKTCDALYQCLIRNNYVNEVLMQNEILVFIWKDGNPVATAEVFYDKKLGQFYGDERGHKEGKDCRPSEEVTEAFNKWLKTFNPYKVEAEHKRNKKIYYKGFQSVDKNGVFHTPFGNYSFEVGKIYATDFLDNEIEEAGGTGCVSTNKVFHFCADINEIKNHYAATCYAEVEALGPVVECNGAFLSNRIKIVKALSETEVKNLMLDNII